MLFLKTKTNSQNNCFESILVKCYLSEGENKIQMGNPTPKSSNSNIVVDSI